MGDRATIVVKDDIEDEAIYLYSQSTGYKIHQTLKDALKRGEERWDQISYLSRIIFSEMIKDDVDGLLGFGISSVPIDSGIVLIVDVAEQTVYLDQYGSEHIPFSKYSK